MRARSIQRSKRHDRDLSPHEAEHRLLEATLDKVEERLTGVETRLDAVEARLTNLEHTIDTNHRELNAKIDANHRELLGAIQPGPARWS